MENNPEYEMQLFNFGSSEITTLIDKDGNPWWFAHEVCGVLDLKNPRQVVSPLDDDEKNTVHIMDGNPGNPMKTIINEPGLYSVILNSNKPKAKPFKRWVTHEVLPSIRKTGGYGVKPSADHLLDDPKTLRHLLLHYTSRVEAQELRIAKLKPQADALATIALTDGLFNRQNTAKILHIQLKKLTAFMVKKGWIYKHPVSGDWCAYADKTKIGYLEMKVQTVRPQYSEPFNIQQVWVTSKGLAKLRYLLELENRKDPLFETKKEITED